MAFGIIRARNLSMSELESTDKHNARKYESEKEYPGNIKIGGEHNTLYLDKSTSDNYLEVEQTNLKNVVENRLQSENVKGIRKNSNVAIEYVCTINDKKAWELYQFSGFVSNTKKWLEDRHGRDSVVAISSHSDESNPHAHFIVVPLKEKEIRWKNAKAQGKRKEVRLNTREYTGGGAKLRKLQDDWFTHLCKRYGEGPNNKFGLAIYRGTLKENQTKTYIKQTKHKIGILRDKISDLKNKEEIIIAKAQLIDKIAQIEQNIGYLTDLNQNKNRYKRNWKNKGTRDNKQLFHTKKEQNKHKNKGLTR